MSALHSPAKIQAPSPPLWVSFADGPCPAQNSHEARRPGCPQTQGSGSPLLFLQRMFHSVKGRLEIVRFLLSTLRYLWASGSCLGGVPSVPSPDGGRRTGRSMFGSPCLPGTDDTEAAPRVLCLLLRVLSQRRVSQKPSVFLPRRPRLHPHKLLFPNQYFKTDL